MEDNPVHNPAADFSKASLKKLETRGKTHRHLGLFQRVSKISMDCWQVGYKA